MARARALKLTYAEIEFAPFYDLLAQVAQPQSGDSAALCKVFSDHIDKITFIHLLVYVCSTRSRASHIRSDPKFSISKHRTIPMKPWWESEGEQKAVVERPDRRYLLGPWQWHWASCACCSSGISLLELLHRLKG